MPPNKDQKTDVDFLKALYLENSVAKAVMDYFAKRQKNATVTKVAGLQTRLRQAGHEFSQGEIRELLRQLVAAGCGRFVVGRRGQPSRIEWAVQIISLAKTAKGEGSAVAPLEQGTTESEDDEEDVPVGLLRHPYRLRQDLTVKLDLPVDFSAKEAARLAEFIKTLPFEATSDV